MNLTDIADAFRREWQMPDKFLTDNIEDLKAELTALPFFGSAKIIGASREGRPLLGLRIGSGKFYATVTAGAHADEPAGPRTAWGLARWLSSRSEAAAYLRSHYTFLICPQINPDGAVANSPWFSEIPDIKTYLRHVQRELPGDDIEFGYPAKGFQALRPENEAVAKFFAEASPRVRYHASLHSMGYARGAWFLLGKNHARDPRLTEFKLHLARYAAQDGFLLHDIDRRGEKGFSRVAPGFCTTPESQAMRDFFLEKNDPATAELFRPNSMELAQTLGDNPVVMVSELPVFSIAGGWVNRDRTLELPTPDSPAPAPGSTAYEQFREAMRLFREDKGKESDLQNLIDTWNVTPVPFDRQCITQATMVILGLQSAAQL